MYNGLFYANQTHMKTPKADEIVYTPRPNKEVLNDLTEGNLPVEIKEQQQLIAVVPESIKQKIIAIIERILKANQIAGDRYQLNIQISSKEHENAAIITHAKQPLLIITKGLLSNVKSEDELAGIIAHELGHLILYKTVQDAEHHNKIEETAADNLGVKLVATAGYDPRAIIYFLQRAGNSEAHLVDSNGLQAEVEKMFQIMTDPHPADENRVRSMETTLSVLSRSGTIASFKGNLTKLPAEFYSSASQISYTTPLTSGMNNIAYADKSILEKICILTELLRSVYPVSNTTADKRLIELAGYIGDLEIDFSNREQIQAFISLTDVVLMQYPDNIVNINGDIKEVREAMTKVWSKGDNNSNYLGRYQDLINAQNQFKQAKTEKEADDAAARIIDLSNRLNLSWYKAPYPFLIPDEKNIEKDLSQYGICVPPYTKYLTWYKERKSENIRTVLLGMELAYDPLVVNILGKDESDLNPQVWLLQQKTGKWGNNTSRVRYVFKSEFTYLKRYKRTEDGSINGNNQIPAYQWKFIEPKATNEEIVAHQIQEAESIKQYEKQIMKDIDWTLLRQDFPQFIERYALLLTQFYSLAPITYSFSEKFYEVLSAELIEIYKQQDIEPSEANKAFVMQVLEFFSSNKTPHSSISCRYIKVYPMHIQAFEENLYWPYKHTPRPALFKQTDPVIQFLLNPHRIPIIPEDLRIEFLIHTGGIYTPDPARTISEQFSVSIETILTLRPDKSTDKTALQTNNIQYLREHYKEYSNLALLIEIERIAKAIKDTLTVKDFLELLILYKDLRQEARFTKFATEGLESFINSLKLPSIKNSTKITEIDLLMRDYRLAVAHDLLVEFTDISTTFYAQIKLTLENLSKEDKQKYLRELLEIKNVDLGNNRYHPTIYQGYIPDPDFRGWAIEEYTDILATQLGQDNGSQEYFKETKKVIDYIAENTNGRFQYIIQSGLANKINAQKALAYYMRDTVKQCSLKEILSNGSTAIFGEFLIDACNNDVVIRMRIINFLYNPLSVYGTGPLLEYRRGTRGSLQRIYNYYIWDWYKDKEMMLENELRDFHQNFTSATLEVKTIYLETLLFPTNSSEEFQNLMIDAIVNMIFPIAQTNDDKDTNELAQLIIKSYLDTANLSERRLLTAALFVANTKETETQEISVGTKLNRVLTNMGPAGGKLLQAIHSHPQTPEVIKRDLASSKTQFSQPSRWDLVELVDKSGLLEATPSNSNPVSRIGKIVGSGSFGITVFNTLEDGALVADTFLRENAGVQAQREFGMMHKAAQNIVAQKPAMKPITYMIEEGKRSAVAEADMSFAQTANILAEQAYEQFNLIQVGRFQFTHQVTKFLARGEIFKRIEIAPGQHFNDLENSAYKTAIAKAMIVTQLTLRLAGINTDLDRHGGNIKVEGSVITHFDFGAMNLEEITTEDKISTGRVLAQAIYAVARNGENFSDALITSIQNATVSEASRNYLNGLNKDFLALGDYINTLNAEELPALLAYCLTAKTVDAQIKATFKEELGFFAELFELNLQWKAKSAGVR